MHSTKVTAWVLGYYFLSLVLQTVLPGVETEGVELASGGRLKYKFNGKTPLPPVYSLNRLISHSF